MFTASEAFRNERIVGVSISIPLGGSYRRERAAEALAQVEVVRAALDAERRALQLRVAETYAEAVSGVQRWRQAQAFAGAAEETARLTQRAYTLGESALQAVLVVRKQLQEARVAAESARVEALRARYRLLLDADMLWTHTGQTGERK